MDAQDPLIGTSLKGKRQIDAPEEGERCGFPVFDKNEVVRTCGKPTTRECLVDGVIFPACDACAAVRSMRDAPARDPLDPIDWHDATAVTRWLVELVAAWKNVDTVSRHMLRPEQRELGHREHERLYEEAAGTLDELFARAVPPLHEEDEHASPS